MGFVTSAKIQILFVINIFSCSFLKKRQEEKELEKFKKYKKKVEYELKCLKNKLEEENREPRCGERDILNVERRLKEFIRSCRFLDEEVLKND